MAILAAIGWLYLLRNAGWLDQGPRLADALPLEQLAAHAAQPLTRVAVAFVPSGLVAALVLAYVGGVAPLRRTAGLALLATLLLVIDSIVSGAIAQNDRATKHIGPTLTHAGVWVEIGLVVIGSLLTARAGRRARPGTGAAASAA